MITRHYKRIVKDILQRGGAKYDAYVVTASDGKTYYTAQEQPNYSSDQTAISKSTDQPGVIIGNGTAAESEDSYWLARQRTSGFSGSVLPTHEMLDGTHTLCLYVTITNTENSSITISEIGYALITPLMRRPSDSQTIGSPYAVERNVLIDRTVLASPITIAAGSSVRLKYALKTTDEIFSGSVVLIQKAINANGVYNASSDNANGYSEVTVNVTPNLQSKTVTQNGTVTPDAGYDGLSQVTVNVQGGGGNSVLCEIDFTKGDFTFNNITIDSNGATFGSSTNTYMLLPFARNGITIEIDVGNMNIPSNSTKYFVCATGTTGFVYRSGAWSFHGSTWESTEITDANYFANSVLKVHVDSDGLWHVYKNNVLVCESSISINMGNYYANYKAFSIGSSGNSITNTVLKGVKIY